MKVGRKNKTKVQFDFGINWLKFSENALSSEKVSQAKTDFLKLFSRIKFKNNTFLDIGFGQGLSLLIASEIGCKVTGSEINPKCFDSLKKNLIYFPRVKSKEIPIILGSILDNKIVKRLKKGQRYGYDIVHSWGVLHHTGNMSLAIYNTASLVKPGGYLIISIYNRHWTSRIWKIIKWSFCKSPAIIQRLMIFIFYPLIFLAKFISIKKNPIIKNRGMNFYYDVVDWIGGYPYEYASVNEIQDQVTHLGFQLLKTSIAEVPTGCNEYVFKKII